MSKRKAEEVLERQECRKEFRKQYKERKENNIKQFKDLKERGIVQEIAMVLEQPEYIDMEVFTGSEEELTWTIERLYENDGL
jgi:plasmid replication initiation protein